MRRGRTVLPGDDRHAVKDPVIVLDRSRLAPLGVGAPARRPGHEDRMTTEHYTSPDGLAWTHARQRAAPARRPLGRARRAGERGGPGRRRGGRRPTTGVPRAEENWEERTGLAYADGAGRVFTASGDAPVAESPHAGRGLRYLSVVDLPDGGVPAVLRGHPRRRRARAAHRAAASARAARRPAGCRGGLTGVRRLPDFLLIGAPKCGTSALHAALARHPELFLSDAQGAEVLPDRRAAARLRRRARGTCRRGREHVWRRADYEALFAAAPPGRCAASRPCSTSTTRRRSVGSATLLPDARLIAVLRDPVGAGALELGAPARGRPRARGGLRRGAGPGAGADRRQAGRTSGTTPRRAATASSSSTCSGCSRASRYCCCATGSCATRPGRRWTACAGSSGSSPGSSPVCRGITSGRTCPAGPSGMVPTERAAAVPRFADDVPRVAELTGWDLTAWQE